jgi:hypothetical protein
LVGNQANNNLKTKEEKVNIVCILAGRIWDEI